MKKIFSKIIFIILIILAVYLIDWGFLRNSITEYGLWCPPDYREGNGCMTVRTTKFYPNKKKQEVITKDEFGIETLKKCTVINRRNWECKYNDESATFGFNNGQFHSTTLWSTSKVLENMDSQYIYVPRLRYLLELWNII